MFIRILLRLKTIQKGNVDAFLGGEHATRKVRLLLLVVKLQILGTADISEGYKIINKVRVMELAG